MKLLLLLFCVSIYSQTVLYFDGNNAMNYLNQQCDLGPRYPGSSGHAKAIQVYKQHFEKYSDNVMLLDDYVIHPHSLDSIKLTNIFSRLNSEINNRILLMAHFDTREIADKDLNQDNQKKPILGANDGASGIAVLMEMVRFLNQNPLSNLGVDFLIV